MSDRLPKGVPQALLAALLFGASTPLAKGLLSDLSPQVLAGLLYLGSGLGLGGLWLSRRGRRSEAEAGLTRRDLPWLLGAIVTGGLLGPLLLLIGLERTPASAASLFLNLEGVLTALLAWFVFHENVDRRVALGMLAIVVGGTVLAWGGRPEWGGIVGPVAIGGACLCWAIDNNLTREVSASDPLQIAALKGGVAGTVNLAIGLMLTGSSADLPRITLALVVGFFGLRDLGTARTGAYFSTAPFVGAILATIFWHEPITLRLLVAGTAMGVGVWLHLTERHGHHHIHEGLSHRHRHVHDAHHQHAHGPHDPIGEPHIHHHEHTVLAHSHSHFPDVHHRHRHE